MWRQEGGGLAGWCRDVGEGLCPCDAHPGRGAGTLQQSSSRAWLLEKLDRSGPAHAKLSGGVSALLGGTAALYGHAMTGTSLPCTSLSKCFLILPWLCFPITPMDVTIHLVLERPEGARAGCISLPSTFHAGPTAAQEPWIPAQCNSS